MEYGVGGAFAHFCDVNISFMTNKSLCLLFLSHH